MKVRTPIVPVASGALSQAACGDDVDVEFLQGMIPHHQRAEIDEMKPLVGAWRGIRGQGAL